jgi:hypothetical protein
MEISSNMWNTKTNNTNDKHQQQRRLVMNRMMIFLVEAPTPQKLSEHHTTSHTIKSKQINLIKGRHKYIHRHKKEYEKKKSNQKKFDSVEENHEKILWVVRITHLREPSPVAGDFLRRSERDRSEEGRAKPVLLRRWPEPDSSTKMSFPLSHAASAEMDSGGTVERRLELLGSGGWWWQLVVVREKLRGRERK